METMKGEPKTTQEKDQAISDLMDSLTIRVKERYAAGGVWATGTMGGYRFEALVFPEHAESPGFELGDSRISKLWLLRNSDRTTMVANFDRGWDVKPTEWEPAVIVDLLADGLADFVFEGRGQR